MTTAAGSDLRGVAMVCMGYALDGGGDDVLTFRVEFFAIEGALGAVRAIGRYNDFDGERVAEALREVAAMVGSHDYGRFSVGREGSPVVYISGLDLDEVKKASEILAAVGADELSAESGTLRAWWD